MKPAPFDYLAPGTLEEILEALAERGDDAKILAGGQSLLPVLNFRLAQPATLIDINRAIGIGGASGAIGATGASRLDVLEASPDGGLRIGALVRQRRIERDPLVARSAPLLAAAMPFVAHPQIRNRGTFGGSVAHADPAAELPAVVLALDARLLLLRRGAERWVEARDFFTGLFATALGADELLAEIELPPPPPRTGFAFQEITRRHGDYALAGVAASVSVDESGDCIAARLVFFSVGDGPVDARRAAATLVGGRVDDQAIRAASEIAAAEEIDPVGDLHASAEFKRHLVRALTARSLVQAVARAREAA